MNIKKGMIFFFVVIALISGSKLLQKYNSKIFEFNEPLSSLIYSIYILGFVSSIIGLLMTFRGRGKGSGQNESEK